MLVKIVALVALLTLTLSTRAEFVAAKITQSGRITVATARWTGEKTDLPPAAIVEEVLEGPWNLAESTLPDDATLVSRVAGSTRATLRALTLVQKPGQRITRKLALPLGTRYQMRVLLPFVSGCDTRYDFRLPMGLHGATKELSVRLGDASEALCVTRAFGLPGAPMGIRYAPVAFTNGQLLRFVTRAVDAQGREFSDEDWFLVYQRGGQTQGLALPLLAGTAGARESEAAENGIRTLFLRQLREATILTFALHGSPDAVAPTLSLSDPQKVTVTEMAVQSSQRGWRPPLQLVFADSCSTLAKGARLIPEALGIYDSTPGRAYIGFDAPAVVDGRCAHLFWETLQAGKTVREAVAAAQRYYDSHNVLEGITYPATLRIVGDPEARLNRLRASCTADWWELITASPMPAQ